MNAYFFDSDIMIFDTGLTLEYQKFSMKKRETTLEACCINAATCCCHNQGMNSCSEQVLRQRKYFMKSFKIIGR